MTQTSNFDLKTIEGNLLYSSTDFILYHFDSYAINPLSVAKELGEDWAFDSAYECKSGWYYVFVKAANVR